jgi:hypothetical protein
LPTSRSATFKHLRNQESIASTALLEELEELEETPNSKSKEETSAQPQSSTASALLRSASDAQVTPGQHGPGELVTSQTAPVLDAANTTTTIIKTDRRNSTASKRSSLISALRRKKTDPSGKISRPSITESAARQDTKLERNLSQLRGIRKSGEGEAEAEPDNTFDEREEEEENRRKEKQPQRSPKLQKRIAGLARSIEAENANTQGAGGNNLPSPLALSSPVAPVPESSKAGTGGRVDIIGYFGPERETVSGIAVADRDENNEFVAPLRRPGTSGNLGTRTLSGAGSQTGSFPQRRTLSSGVMSLVAPSVATTTDTGKKKKKFGALRRMFGLAD